MVRTEAKNVDEYIASFPDDIKNKLLQIKEIILTLVPEAKAVIKYEMPTFVYHGNMLSFGVYKSHIGIYPYAEGDGDFEEAIAPYRSGKATLKFDLKKPLPTELISILVTNREKLMKHNAKS